jgi:hypothetical protein
VLPGLEVLVLLVDELVVQMGLGGWLSAFTQNVEA